MKFLRYIIFLLFAVLGMAFLPTQKKVSLLVAEYDDNVSKNHLQHLVNYVFVDGAMVSKEVLLSVPTQKEGVKGNYVRFDLGKNTIYRNRYIITGIGNVIDIKTKKLLVSERAEFVSASGDSLIFFTNDIFKGKYYSVLNVATGNYGKVENPNYAPVKRPDVEVDETTKPYSISAYHVSGKKDLLVKDAGYGEAQPLLGDDIKRKFPIFWIDNSNFLFANFSKDQHSVSIVKVNLNKTSEKVAEIHEIPATAQSTSFEWATDGSIIYSCGKGRFLIDVKKKLATKLIFEPLGNNFFVESDENPKYGRTIKYEANEAGKKWCKIENSKTTNGYAAVQNDMVIGGERYPQGVAVWNSGTKKWTSLEVNSLAEIVGWVEE